MYLQIFLSFLPSPLSSPRYTEVANNVQKEETVLSVQFVLLDCAPLKFSLVQHCNEWQGKFTQLLSLMASTRLKELHVFLQENALRWVGKVGGGGWGQECVGSTL